MKIAVIINGQAGYADRHLIETSVRQALFRCELEFFAPSSIEELQATIVREADRTDVLMICGGDGTLNTAVQPLLKARASLSRMPTLCPLPVGTANDLAREMGISRSIERAARLVLEGEKKKIDIIEIEAHGVRKYMITNGGLGIPAVTADVVNRLRNWVISRADCENTKAQYRPALQLGKKIIKKAGARIYEITMAGQLAQWETSSWNVEIEIPGRSKFETRAPFIMINNQPGIGGTFIPAPLTHNADGTFNVMMLQSLDLLSQVRTLLQIRGGGIPDESVCPRFEASECVIRRLEGSRPLTFFGDGEILHKDVDEIRVKCLAGELPLFVKRAS